MKKVIHLALLFLATTAVPAIAQNASPQCGSANFDKIRNIYTIKNPTANTVNQQCFLTVYKKGSMHKQAKLYPASYLLEGNYVIELSGGGGGGGGGASMDQAGGGGGGAGAAPLHVIRYLAPGSYKMTIGTGGSGGSAEGGRTESGNPTSLTNASTGELIAGFQGADAWKQHATKGAEEGRGAGASSGGSRGGAGGSSDSRFEETALSGGKSGTPGYLGKPGESGRNVLADAQGHVGGGGGGAGVGSGGAGDTASRNTVAGEGDLGGGGGGGRGGINTAKAGAQGGHGFIRLTYLPPIL